MEILKDGGVEVVAAMEKIQMTNLIRLDCVVKIDEMRGEDDEDTMLLRDMAIGARKYLTTFAWCQSIIEQYYGCGVGGIIAVFLFHIKPVEHYVDEWLWVVEGDIPSAYIVTDMSTTPGMAIRVYCDMMDSWSKSVMEGRTLTGEYPVTMKPTREVACQLQSRICYIRKNILIKYYS